MEATRHGQFKLAKQTGKTAHFARVTVEIAEVAAQADIITISASPQAIRGWAGAAANGASQALRELRTRGYALGCVRIDVTSFVGIPTDTTDKDADAAAFMAVISAFPELLAPTIEYSAETDGWIVRWS